MSAHTPGPWKVDTASWDNDFGITTEDEGQVAAVFADEARGHADREALANARLIAAAPELLAALKTLTPEFGHSEDCGARRSRHFTCSVEAGTACAHERARSAIAKVEGDR